MTPAEILNQARYITKTSTSDGTGAESDLLRILNDYYLRQATIFVNTNEDKFGVRASTSLNVASDQEAYELPDDCMRIKRLEVNYTGSSSAWKKARAVDAGQIETTALDSTDVNNLYSTASPYYEVFGDYFYLRPIPTVNVSGGLFLWYIQRPTLLSTISSAVLTPSEYHGYLAYGVAAEIATRQGNDALAASMFQKWEDGRVKIETQFVPYNMDYQLDLEAYPNDYS